MRRDLVQGCECDEGRVIEAWSRLKNIDLLLEKPEDQKLLGQMVPNLKRYVRGQDSRFKSFESLLLNRKNQTEILKKELQIILDLFNKQLGIQPILLKGMALLHLFPEECQYRPSSDIDLLIPIQRREEVMSLLQAYGWKSKANHHTRFYDWSHAYPMQRPNQTEVDIHWHLLPEDMSWQTNEKIWARSRILPSMPQSRVLHPEDLLFHLIIHGTRKISGGGLQWIIDSNTLLHFHPKVDWAYLVEWAVRTKLQLALAEGLRVLKDYGAKIPGDVPSMFKMKRVSFVERWQFQMTHEQAISFGKIPLHRVLLYHFRYFVVWNHRFHMKGKQIGPVDFLKYYTNSESIFEALRNTLALFIKWKQNK